MKRTTSLGAWMLCAALTVACGSNRSTQTNASSGTAAAPLANAAKTRPQPVDVRGCLTASGDRFVLTTLRDTDAAKEPTSSATAVPTTETYQLVSASEADLQKYVGQEVRVAGEADAARVADVRELTPAVPADRNAQHGVGTSGRDGTNGGTPTVKTEEDTHFEVRKLRVSSVTPTGGACPATTPSR